MVGYLRFTGAGGQVRIVPHAVLGLTVWEARLPKTSNSPLARRRTLNALDRLERAGCRRLLTPCPLAPAYPIVHTRSLWQALAVPLALTALRAQGLEPRRSVVAVRCRRMTRPLLRTCVALAREVSALALSPVQDEGFIWHLQQELGLPLVTGEGDVTLSYVPALPSSACFPLGDADPPIAGFRPVLPEAAFPEGCPELPVLSALLDAGRLPLDRMLVVPDFS